MRFGLRHIRYFQTVAEELHFRRAAAKLNVAQPAISRAVRHLEQEVGVRLLDRSNRQVALTAAGETFLEGCREIANDLEAAVARARKAASGAAGHLQIGYTDFAISGSLPQILMAFRQHYPDVSVEAAHGVTRTQLEDLEAGRLDIGFVTGPLEHAGMEGLTVQQDRLIAVLYEGHPLARRARVPLRALAKEPFILGTMAAWQHYHDHLFRACRAAGFEPEVVQQASNSEGIFGLIACRIGISVQAACAQNYIRKGLAIRPLADCDATVPTVAAWHRERMTPAKQRFVELLASCRADAPDGAML